MPEGFDIVEEYWGEEEVVAAKESAIASSPSIVETLESDFATRIGAIDAAFVPSGRAAIYHALSLLGAGPGSEVILPAFLCRAVADEVLRCGAAPVLVDVRLPGGEIDSSAVDAAITKRTRAVVAAHLFGVPTDFRSLRAELQGRDIALIEDCAHCLLGRTGGSVAGTAGDFSIFSFNYDKPISLGGGGMLVCASQHRLDAFRSWKQSVPKREHHGNIEEEAADLLAFSAGRRSWRDSLSIRAGGNGQAPERRTLARRVARKLPLARAAYRRFLAREGISAPELPRTVGAVRAALGLRLLERYPTVLAQRNANALRLRTDLVALGFGEAAAVRPEVEPAYLRLNMLVRGHPPSRLDRMAGQLRLDGYRCGRLNWPESLDLDEDLARRGAIVASGSESSNAQTMSEHSFNLPVHQRMTAKDVDRLVRRVSEAKDDEP